MAKDKLIETLRRELNEQKRINAELLGVIDNFQKTVDELHLTIDGLNQTIKELTESLNKNSTNSSKPPSSDGLNKPSPKSLRKPSGKKPGGQVGHPGSTLSIVSEPDEIILHMPSACDGCPNYDVCKRHSCVDETRQIIDAVVEVKVTAHRSLAIENCPLYGGSRKAEFPDGVNAPVQYGVNLQALVVALNTVGAVSVKRTHEILSSVFNIPLSSGTINNMVGRCASGLTGIVETIRRNLIDSAINNFDETGTRVDGRTMWVHCSSNAMYTLLTISERRGKEGMDENGVLPLFEGTAIHDCWAPYWKYPGIIHGLCNAHLLRELIGVLENHPEQLWAEDFKKLLLDMKETKEKAVEKGNEQLSGYYYRKFFDLYDEIIRKAYEANPLPPETGEKKRGRKKKGKVRALIERLNTHKASVCLFIEDFAVPFDNNQGERDLRMVKTKTKVSGCFRSKDGAEDYLKIMSYVGTAKKQNFNPYEAIRQAILGTPEIIFAQ